MKYQYVQVHVDCATWLYIGKSKTEERSLHISIKEGERGSFKVSSALT